MITLHMYYANRDEDVVKFAIRKVVGNFPAPRDRIFVEREYSYKEWKADGRPDTVEVDTNWNEIPNSL